VNKPELIGTVTPYVQITAEMVGGDLAGSITAEMVGGDLAGSLQPKWLVVI